MANESLTSRTSSVGSPVSSTGIPLELCEYHTPRTAPGARQGTGLSGPRRHGSRSRRECGAIERFTKPRAGVGTIGERRRNPGSSHNPFHNPVDRAALLHLPLHTPGIDPVEELVGNGVSSSGMWSWPRISMWRPRFLYASC